MIRNQWYVVLESNEVKSRPVGVTRLGEKLIFWREPGGKVCAALDRCPHRGVALSKGKIQDGHLQCPFHGFEFDGSGRCRLIPANGRKGAIPNAMQLNTYPTYEAHGLIWLWWGNPVPEGVQAPEFFDDLDDTFSYGSAHDPWDAHYSRVIENQLDVVHLPFIHGRTIGRGNRTLVDGPVVEWKGDRLLYTYVFNRVDDGTPPRRPRELSPREASSVHLEFIFPNLWQNYISQDVRILAAFVPVDDEHTLLYLRFYQRFLHVPVLGKLLAQLAMPVNLYIAHEDRRVVVTQQPKASGLKIGEILIPGDLPIVEYRRKRAALMDSRS
ncbi:phenylpropionate dioxygenase [Longilinea arvoryzae]|uniref:Phenylpropionate dioxygenase n=1 Tax=Longilinea arvoryzae TaxID=360412 RepID=A0A0S7B6V0_9CHLR|nr:aromatic ring-hydroxylating dioxygenase subunit alpha [Longilinea arvoryzae]GAP12686.1 phenylpropionate dioxygenase [Longilinea arvoryzae]